MFTFRALNISKMLVEVCANSLESALNAEKGGADRIELCSELGVGGVTPSFGLLKNVMEKVTIPVHVLIRPRSGDFTYSDLEIESMNMDIEMCRELGCAGIVSGVLHLDSSLDSERTKKLIAISKGMTFTFHRAFDWVKDPLETLAQLEQMEVDYILSSGQQKSSFLGIKLLSQLQQLANKCIVMPGGGINAENAAIFKEKGFKVIHLSGSKSIKTLGVAPRISMNSPGFIKDDEVTITQINVIQKVVHSVK